MSGRNAGPASILRRILTPEAEASLAEARLVAASATSTLVGDSPAAPLLEEAAFERAA